MYKIRNCTFCEVYIYIYIYIPHLRRTLPGTCANDKKLFFNYGLHYYVVQSKTKLNHLLARPFSDSCRLSRTGGVSTENFHIVFCEQILEATSRLFYVCSSHYDVYRHTRAAARFVNQINTLAVLL